MYVEGRKSQGKKMFWKSRKKIFATFLKKVWNEMSQKFKNQKIRGI